jgi:WD40 repeat protein
VAAAVPLASLDADGVPGTVTELLPPGDLAPADVACPYKGLAVFEAEDAGYFFGREEMVADLTARLAGTRFLAVVGPSGSGKSSVVRAGLLPAIWGGALPGSREWQTLVLTPGAHPLEELAVRVSLLRSIEASALLEALRARPEALHLAVKQALADEPEGARLLLVVDQFEEIFALCRNATERRAFIDALLHAVDADKGRTVVVPTIRADFYGRCADYPELAARMSDGVLVGPMSPAELREAITRPAEMVGLRLEPGLVDTVIGDVAEEPGALPLLSHALLETFGRRRGRTLTLSGYAASGAVAGAIAQTADTVYDSLDPEQQDLARSIFLQLTELGEEGSQDTRRRVSPAELVRSENEGPRVEALLRTLADARLVTTGGGLALSGGGWPVLSASRGTVLSASEGPVLGASEGPVLSASEGPVLSASEGPVLSASEGTVEVAHEALIREWGRLREWLDASRDDLRAHRRLTVAAAEWVDAGRDDGFLLRGSRLSQFETWANETAPSLTRVERDYIEASVVARAQREAEREQERAARARAEEQARRSRQLRRLAVGLAAVLVLAIVAGVFALIQRNESQRLLRLSVSHRLTAASINSFETYPERSVLLALEAVEATYAKDKTVTREADAALRRALEALRLQRTLFGHGGPVYGVAVSPDGTCLATASADRTARVWDAASGEELYTLSGHTGLVRSVAFGPAGAKAGRCGAALATAGDDGTARVWSLASSASTPGEELLRLAGHTGRVSSVVFSPDGRRLATASEDGTAKIWDATTGRELLTLAGHAGPVYGVSFSPDGTRLATASEDGTAREWSLASSAAPSGEELLTLSGHAGPVYAVAFSRDGSRLATAGGDGTARVWDSTSGEELFTFSGHSGAVRGVTFAPDGTGLATAGEDETAKVWSLGSSAAAQGQELLTLFGHTGPVYGVAFSPDGIRLATASEDRTAKVWNISASQGGLSLSGHTAAIWSAAFSPDGTRLATASGDGMARVWDAASGEELFTLSGHTDEINVVAFDPDGTYLATASLDGTAKVWDGLSGQELLTLNGHSGWVMSVAFSPDGTRLATAGGDGTAKVWDAASGQELLTLTGHDGRLIKLAFSPDGTRLATASQDGTARVWDAMSGRELRTLSGRAGAVFSVAFSPDGARLATANEDGTGRLWDVTSGQELLTLSDHSDWVVDVAFSPSGASLATASADGTVRVWDAASGREQLSFSGDADMVNSVAYSPDGTRLVAAGTDGIARIYVLDVEELVSLACSRITRNLTEAEWQTYLGQDVAYRRTCPDLPVPPAWLTYGHID